MAIEKVNLYSTYLLPIISIHKQIINSIYSIENNELKYYVHVYLNNNFNNENINITKENIKDNTHTQIRNGYYKQQKLKYMNYLYLFLITIYILCFIGTCVILYKKDEMKTIVKIAILLSLFFLPIFSTKLLLIILYIMQSFQKHIPKNVHMEKIKLFDINN